MLKLSILALMFLQRPVTCKPGVAYWDITGKVLYKCTAPNVWSASYKPKGSNLPTASVPAFLRIVKP